MSTNIERGVQAGLGALLGALALSGLRSRADRSKWLPNQAIRNSLRNAVTWGALAAASASVGTSLLSTDGRAWINGAALAGLTVALAAGGLAVIQHYVLRVFLAIFERVPLTLVHFLEYAHNLIFLRCIGDGYVFLHDLLREHFALIHSCAQEKRHSQVTAASTPPSAK